MPAVDRSYKTIDREADMGAARQGAHVTEMQRSRLLGAIGEVVAEHGLEGAGVAHICKRAGVSRRTFYELFDDREACLLASLAQAVERISRRVSPSLAGEQRWRERVRGALIALLELFEQEPALARMCVIETLKAGPGVLELRFKVLDALAAVVREGRTEAKSDAAWLPLTAESAVGGAVSVIHARLIEADRPPLTELTGPLMSMIVQPYLGPAAARKELERPAPISTFKSDHRVVERPRDPFKDLPIRITFRTANVLVSIARQPGASNRQVSEAAQVPDQGQMSKLLNRLQRAGLIENRGEGHASGKANVWVLTGRGEAVQAALGVRSAAGV